MNMDESTETLDVSFHYEIQNMMLARVVNY